MAAVQSLKLVRGFGAFILAGTTLTPDTAAGSPYNAAAGTIDFSTRATAQQQLLAATHHAANPQQSSATVAFVYSDWTP